MEGGGTIDDGTRGSRNATILRPRLTSALARRIGDDEREEAKVSLRVADHEIETLEVECGKISLVVLNAFPHEHLTGFAVEAEFVACLDRRGASRFLEIEQRFAGFRPCSVGPSRHLHLNQAHVEPHLDLVTAIVAGHDPDLKIILFVYPSQKENI